MAKTKKIVLSAAAVLVIGAGTLLLLLFGPKQTPWELTKAIVPGEVTNVYVWTEKMNCNIKHFSEEEIAQVVYLLNQLEKPDFTENASHAGTTPSYGLHMQCGNIELMINQVGGTKIEMNFDAETAKSLYTDQWVIDNAALADFIRGFSGFTLAEEAAR